VSGLWNMGGLSAAASTPMWVSQRRGAVVFVMLKGGMILLRALREMKAVGCSGCALAMWGCCRAVRAGNSIRTPSEVVRGFGIITKHSLFLVSLAGSELCVSVMGLWAL
jgi:hypothetical protein